MGRAANVVKKLPKIKNPKKPKRPHYVTCTCRAISNQECETTVQTAFGTATAKSLSKAQKDAKDKLGKQAKHDSCVCIDSKGKITYTKGG